MYSLQQVSADREVKIAQITKQYSLEKEDLLQSLNIALDSKQQELDLVCFFSFLISSYLHAVSYPKVPRSSRGKMVSKAPLAVLLLSHPRYLIVVILRSHNKHIAKYGPVWTDSKFLNFKLSWCSHYPFQKYNENNDRHEDCSLNDSSIGPTTTIPYGLLRQHLNGRAWLLDFDSGQ